MLFLYDSGARISASLAVKVGDADEPLWPWRRNRRQLFPWFRRLVEEQAGVALPRGKCFHSLRRTHGTAVCELFGLEMASQSLGHTNTQTTKLYVARDRLTVLRVADRLPRP